MAEEQYYAPLGPYKEYAPGGDIGQLPPAPKQDDTFIDPRTGVYYGAYTEEEIMQDQVDILGTSIYRGLDPIQYSQNRIALDATIKPEEEQGTTNAGEIISNEYRVGVLGMESANLGYQALDLPIEEDDSAFIADGMAKREEAAKLKELSIVDNRGLVFETTRFMANQIGLLRHMGPEVIPKVGVPFALEAAANLTPFYKGFTATKFAGTAVSTTYFVKQMRGEIYLSLRDPLEGIDRDIARDKANLIGTFSGVSEVLGFRNFLKAAGVTSDMVTRISNVAQEGGQEMLQSILEDVALWSARKEQAERDGVPYDVAILEALDMDKAREGAKAGILTAGGFAVPGAAVKYSAGAVKAVQDADKKHIIRKQATELIKSYNEKQAELVDIADKPTIDAVDPVTGQPVETAPLDDVEVEQANGVDGVAGTTVTDGEVDDFMLLDDPAEIDAAANRLVSAVNEVDGVFTAGRFFNNLRAILPAEEAKFVEQIMNARALSAGVDTNTYIKARQLAIKEAGYKERVNAEVTFTEEGRAIIKAFTGANVSSVLHEVGHVFRRDLRGQDLATVERWAGVEPGQQWDKAAEEKFARAWEKYLADGTAPSQELIPAFNAFTKWITNIYKTLVGSEIDIEFDDNVRQVFDNLLVAQEGAKAELEPIKQQAMTLQQARTERDEVYAAQSADRISTAYPTGGKRTVDPDAEIVEIGIDTAKQVPASFKKNANIINNDSWTDTKGEEYLTYPGFKTRKRKPEAITEEYIEHGVGNLLWLYDQIPEPIRERSKMWYDGARHITDMWSERYGLPPSNVAGILASLSPQKDWYQNVSLAERVIDVMQAVDGTATSIGTENKKFAVDLYRNEKGVIDPKNQKLIDRVVGTPFNELPDALHQATFVRIYDALHNDRGYRIVTPEGAFTGEPVGQVAWGSNSEIAKAVKAYGAQSNAFINTIMGDSAHKIRNFYNNIIAPNNGVDVTIDTHAKAALLLRPLSAKSFEVGHTFGGRGSGSKISGAYGLYGVDAEVYRRAAEQRDILPREMQSITWEAVRGLFEDTYKRVEGEKAKSTGFTTADAIWKRYEAGEITLDQARQEVVDHAGGINNPTWYGPDSRVSEEYRGTSYEGELSGRGVSERTTGPLDDGAGSQPTGGPTRLQQSRSGASEAELRAKYLQELLDRTAARDTAVAAAEGKLNPSKTLAEQIKAHRREMRKLFAAGETEGAKNERNKIKALLARQRNRADVQKRHTAVRKQIIKLLEENMPKKISRKLQSGMDYDTQKVITELYEALMDENQDQKGVPFLPVKGGLNTIEGVKQMYYKYIEGAVAVEPLTPVQVLRNQIIVAALKRDKFGLEGLQEVYGQLGALVKAGKKASPAMVNLFKARGLVQTAVPQITGTTAEELNDNIDNKDLQEANRQRQKEKNWRTKLATMKLGKDGLLAWGDLLELISAYSGARPGESTLMQELDFFDSSQAKKTDIRTQMGSMIKAYAEAYGIRTNIGSFEYHNSIHAQQNRDLKRDIDIGWNRIINRAQLRQIWMYMQDHNLTERLVGNGIAAGQREAVERNMTAQDRQFAQHLMNMFQDDTNYQNTNEVYKRAFGVDLERFENYVPLNAEPIQTTQQALEKDQDTMNQFQQDKYLRKSATSAGSLNKRIEDLRISQLIFNGDLPLFQSWLEETAHFRAYADIIRLASAVVNDRDFRKAVVYEYGQSTYNAIQKNLIANAADARATAENINAVDRIRTAYVTGTIGMATTVTMKQYISLLNFWQDMPFTSYVSGLASLPANTGLIKDILASDYMKNRRGSIDRDLKQAMSSKEYKQFMLNPSVKNFLTFNVTLGDSGAIALGGAVYVRYLMKQVNPETGAKYTKAQAIHEMGRRADRTQQSASIEQLSSFQQGNSFAKIITTYSTGPVQATRQILAANRNLAAGRISVPQYVKEMFIYQVAVPIMFSLAAGAIAGDDSEEQLKNAGVAAILGPWGSTYAMGRIVTAAVRKASGMTYFENAGPFTDTMSDLAGYTNKIASDGWDSLTLDQYARAVQSTLVLFGYGIPLTRVSRMIENAAAGEPVDAFFATNPNM